MAEEILFDVLKHKLVPKHRIITDEERKVLLEKYNIAPLQLPKMFSTDAVSKALGAKIGDIVRIERASPTAGNTVYFRIVIKKTK